MMYSPSRLVLALVVLGCCIAIAHAANTTNSSQLEVSTGTQAVIEVDRIYAQQLRAQKYQQQANKPAPAVGEMEPSMVYHYDVASQLMWHSVSAYCTDDPSLHDWSCRSCAQFGDFTITQVMDDTANQGYVGYFTQGLPASPIDDGTGRVQASDPFVLISMRGTVESDIEDWIEDLSLSKMAAFSDDYPDVSVHSGFWGSYQDLKPKMMQGLQAALQASGATTVLVTGHSLGAAMAELAALDLKINEYPDLNYASYTQGCPRVGNDDFSALYSALMNTSFREVHHADIVPHLPPLLLDFVHGPMEIWFDEDWTQYTICNSTMSGEDPLCSNSLIAPISIPDHLKYRGVDLGTYCTSSKKITIPDAIEVPVVPISDPDVVPTAAATINVTIPSHDAPVAPVASAPVSPSNKHPRRPKIILTE